MITNNRKIDLIILFALAISSVLPRGIAQEAQIDFKLSASFTETAIKVCVTAENRGDKPLLFPGPFHFLRGGLLLPLIETDSGEAAIRRVPKSGGGGSSIPPHWKSPLSYQKLEVGNQLRSCDVYELDNILVDHLSITVEYNSWLDQKLAHPFSGTDLLVYDLIFKDKETIGIGTCKFEVHSKVAGCS